MFLLGITEEALMKYLRYSLKVLNPLIAVWNFFKYQAHLETYRYSKEYVHYDFSQDTPYF
jgi:hypothetical protein